MINRDQVMEHLLEVTPSFKERWNKHINYIWDRESDVILYTDLSEYASHLSQLFRNDGFDELYCIFEKIEYLILEGDFFVREAIVIGLLEDLQNNLLVNNVELSLINKYLCKNTAKYWDNIIDFWNEDIKTIPD